MADPPDPNDPSTVEANKLLRQLQLDGWAVTINATAEALRKAALAGAEPIYEAQLDTPFDVVDESAVEYAWDRAAELVGKRVLADGTIIDNPDAQWAITDSTRDTLREIVRVAMQDGWSTQQLKTHIRDSAAFGSQRALMIARTEASRAHNFGAQAAAKAGGFAKYKEWLLGSEHTVDDECDDASDDGPIPIDEDFSSGDPHPPAHPSCSCTVIYTEEASDAKVEKQEVWTVGAEAEKPTTSSSPIDLTESTEGRAWNGQVVELEHPMTPLELGREGERLALSFVRKHLDLGDPQTLNTEQDHEVDMIVDHQAFEIVSAQVNNAKQEWRVAIEQPAAGPIETAWFKLLSPEQQAAHKTAKRQALIERKQAALDALSRELGTKVVPKTFAQIINPDTGLVDFYIFAGFHERLDWPTRGQVASYKYGEF